MTNIYRYLGLLILCILIAKCTNKTVPNFDKNIISKLSLEILKSSEQIFYYKKDIILLYNKSDRQDIYEPYLLFYNKKREFYGFHYYSSEMIEGIETHKIKGILNKARVDRSLTIKSSLPKEYSIDLYEEKTGQGIRMDKIIEDIRYIQNSKKVTLYIKRSSDRYAGLNWTSNAFISDYKSKFIHKDTLSFKLSDLHFDSEENQISSRYLDDNNNLVWDRMIIYDKELLNSFYSDLYNSEIE